MDKNINVSPKECKTVLVFKIYSDIFETMFLSEIYNDFDCELQLLIAKLSPSYSLLD